jgi:hypothetical protein
MKGIFNLLVAASLLLVGNACKSREPTSDHFKPQLKPILVNEANRLSNQ